MELFRLSIVYLHLIACCVAIGLVLTSDIAMVKQLIKGDTAEKQETEQLNSLKKTVTLALVALWITGIAIVWLDVSVKGFAAYFSNPKMQAKLTIVALLTLNGFVLHSAVMPAMEKAGSLLQMAFNQRMLAIFAGAVSAVSWFYAAMLGVGRPLAWKYSIVQLLAAYPALIVTGFIAMVTLTVWSKYRSDLDFSQFAEAHSRTMK
ncbi:putative membrane protein DUF2214 [Collimonas sp. PA-H2]|uniref:DUF2214 family protein n=1 Tax=Collimonas sp. PA-H2 TaxID=1881062 RepID=UPI000BF5E786|nr:DUF2214 family protein [Collimonas sp. PA-H2]PFH08743.1 putative membrane protein DUF2214 [Collimonas sp. PA-H2]